MPTYIVKYNDDSNELTAYCEDDKTKTEIGPARWNDATNQLEIHCGGNVYPVKWNNIEKRLEARNVSEDCCCVYTNNCTDCYAANQTPKYMQVTLANIVDCGGGDCDWADGTFYLTNITACGWLWASGDNAVNINQFSGISKTTINAYKNTPTVYYCFKNWTLDTCIEEYNNLANEYNVGDCGGTVIGYDGTASWTPSCTGS